MKRIIFVGLTLTVWLTGCKQDPYSGKKAVGVRPPQEKPKEGPAPGAFALEAQDIMVFNEGQLNEYYVKGAVPQPGTAVVEFKNLPPGANYNPTTQKLTWAPDYQAANDPNNPLQVSRNYLVDIRLYNNQDPSIAISRQVYMTVNDTPRPAGVKSPLEMNGTEGRPLLHRIDFEDQEYPSGPFEITVAGLPNDIQIDWPNRSVPSFNLKWMPGYDKLIGQLNADFNGHIVLYNPRGKRLEFNIKWTIYNQFSAPIVAGPTDITQPVDVDFVVMAEDLNGEFTPQWTSTHPGYGNLTVVTQAVSGGGRPRSAGLVSWKSIPADKLGTTATLQLKACLPSTTLCSIHTVRVLPTTAVQVSRGKK